MAINIVYVDPDGGSDTGPNNGSTEALAFKTLDGCFNTGDNPITRHAEGDAIHIKNSAFVEYPTAGLSITTYLDGALDPTDDQPLMFIGYGSELWDGQKTTIDPTINSCTAAIIATAYDWITYANLHFASGADTHASVGQVLFDNYGSVINCKFDKPERAIIGDNYLKIVNNEFEGVAPGSHVSVVECDAGSYVAWNWFKADSDVDGTLSSAMLVIDGANCTVQNNIFTIEGAAPNYNAILIKDPTPTILHNSIDGGGGEGTAIKFNDNGDFGSVITSNIIANFGSGVGIDWGSTIVPASIYAGNAFYNNSQNETNFGDSKKTLVYDHAASGLGNETVGSDPFARTGGNTFTNRMIHWSPNDVGNILGGAWPSGL